MMCDQTQTQTQTQTSHKITTISRLKFWAISLCLLVLYTVGCAAPKHTYQATNNSNAQSYATRTAAPSVAERSSGAYRPNSSVSGNAYKSSPADSHERRGQIAQPREERPGLGTAYGESLYAPVNQVNFYRSTQQPLSILSINYNNPEGIMAMARHLGNSSCCSYSSGVYGAGIRVNLIDQYGNTLRGLTSGGRVWVMGQHGQRYRIRIQNHTSQRHEVVISVDGLDVIDGSRASFDKRGYIVAPQQTLIIDGFRRSYNYVAAFRFSSVSHSYAARTSGSNNVGVIGVAVYAEQNPAWSPSELQRRLHASPFAAPPQ